MATISASWIKLSFPDERKLQRSSQVLSVVEDIAYAFGGELLPRQPRDNHVYKLDCKAAGPHPVLEITGNSESPSPRVGTASATLNGKIYIFSGRGGTAMTPIEEQGAVWEFDPPNTTWTKLVPGTPFPSARSYHCATSNGDDRVYIHAGCPESGRLADLWSFQPSNRTWVELHEAPGPARGGTSIAFHNGLLYRMNGFDGKTEQGGSLDIYDTASNSWSTKKYAADGVSGPTPRSVSTLSAVMVNGKPLLVTLFGEQDPSSLGHEGAGKMLSDVWAYDIQSGTWTKISTKLPSGSDGPAPRGWFDADVIRQSSVLVSGGLGESNERLSDAWQLQF